MTNQKELIYVGDPMCSWCYGFAPIKTRIEEQAAGRAAVKLLVGGLHIDWTEPQDEARKKFLREHWLEIGQRSGQPFMFDILDRDDFVYNTEASCRAAVTVREMKGQKAALKFFTYLQSAFYADNADITQGDILIDLAGRFGLDKDAFAEKWPGPEMVKETLSDFRFAQRLGVTGFPTMVVKDSYGYAYLTIGYQPYEQLAPVVEAWLEDKIDRSRPPHETVTAQGIASAPGKK
jgi:putative protein-disulfide isomerase